MEVFDEKPNEKVEMEWIQQPEVEDEIQKPEVEGEIQEPEVGGEIQELKGKGGDSRAVVWRHDWSNGKNIPHNLVSRK